jgi:hypothetical protein
MKDQLISFETAKLARELGFNESCGLNYAEDGEVQLLRYWEGNGNGFESNSEIDCDYYIENNPVCSAPTQSLLQRWLREIHDIDVYVIPNGSRKKSINKRLYHPQLWVRDEYQSELHSKYTYEEALEEGLQEALKQIK